MEKKKSGEMTFQEFFDSMKQQLLAPLKREGFTETQINEMKMKEVWNLLTEIGTRYKTLLDVSLRKMEEKEKVKARTTPIKPVDLENMLGEIRTLREKYSIPKGMLFVPDKMEISVQRISYDNFKLSYKEFFNYLPDSMLDLAITATINMMMQIGVARELIKRIDRKGVSVEKSDNFTGIMGGILPELLIQKRLEDEEISSLFNAVQKIRKTFADFSELEYEWNSEIENRFCEMLEKLSRVIQEHPSVQAELEAIVKKYTQGSKN